MKSLLTLRPTSSFGKISCALELWTRHKMARPDAGPEQLVLQDKASKGGSCIGDAGWELALAKMQATWGKHEPSYFVATHQERKELLCVIRGTAQMEDLVTDLVAHPVVSPAVAPLLSLILQQTVHLLTNRHLTCLPCVEPHCSLLYASPCSCFRVLSLQPARITASPCYEP